MRRVLLLATLPAGCAISSALPDRTVCRAERPIGYVGQRYSDRIGGVIKDKAHAAFVRAIRPGMMVTQEFREDRLDVALDEHGTIARIYCG